MLVGKAERWKVGRQIVQNQVLVKKVRRPAGGSSRRERAQRVEILNGGSKARQHPGARE